MRAAMSALVVPTLAVLAAALSAAPAGALDKANPSATERVEESANKVKELQKERIATLEKLVKIATAQYQRGRVSSYEAVVEAMMQLLKAELEAAEKESDRIALYEMTVDALKQLEQLAQARVAAGRATSIERLGIKARRLEVEIQLERAKAKEAKQGK